MAEKGETKKKKRNLKIGMVILIIILIVISSIYFIIEPFVKTAEQEDIRITLTNQDNEENLTQITIMVKFENIRDYPIHLDGDYTLNISIININNNSEMAHQSISVENHEGTTWDANHQDSYELIVKFSTEKSNETRQYQIQYHYSFGDKKVSSNIINYKTSRKYKSFEISEIK
jgi:hypothetical protein